MKRQRTVLVAAIMTTMAVHADVINVSQGQTLDVSSSVTVTSMEVHGTLNIAGNESSPAVVTLEPSSLNVPLGSASGDNAIINIGSYGRVSGGNFMFGGPGGVGGFVVGGAATGNPQWNGENAHLATGQMTVSPDATSDSGVIDILTLNEGAIAGLIRVGRQAIVNRSKNVDARVLFNGGTFYLFNCFDNFLFTTDYDSRYPDVVKPGEGGKNIIFESVDANPIRISYLNGGSIWPSFGNVRFRGAGDVILHSEYSENAASWNLQAQNAWEQKGDLILSGSMGMKLYYWSILPNSSENGIVKVLGSNKCFLDLNGYGQWLTGLVIGGDASLKNTASGTAELVLGSSKSDCVLSVKKIECVGAVKVTKKGSGTLSVTNTPFFPQMQLESGRILFKDDDCSLDSLTVARGTSIVVDGCTLTLKALINDGATFSCVNGGRVVQYVDGSVGENYLVPSGITSFVKNGTGTVVLHQDTEQLAGVHVTAGTLAVAKTGTANHWFRFSFTKMNNDQGLQLSEIRLMNSNGNPVGGLLDVPNTCAISDMPAGSVLASDESYYLNETDSYKSRKPSALFDYQTWTRVWYGTAPSETAPKIFVVRLPDDWEIYQYNFRNGYSGAIHPTAWKVETSPDGINWMVSDCHSGVTPPSANGSFYNDGVHYKVMSGSGGAVGFSPSAQVRVDRGAVLDCSRVTGGQVFSDITVDCADGSGFGKIVNAVFASTGVIRIENMPDGMKRGYCELPLAFVDVSGAENLKEWTVIINGAVVSKRKAALQNGYLALMPSGLNIIVR